LMVRPWITESKQLSYDAVLLSLGRRHINGHRNSSTNG
jgi:hypothetical protein